MIREWEISTQKGAFTFVAENKTLAHDHAMCLKLDPAFGREHGEVLVSGNVDERVRFIGVRFVGWTERL